MKIRKYISATLGKFRTYRTIREILKVGIVRSLRWRWLLRRIMGAQPIKTRPWPDSFSAGEIHILTSADDYLLALWSAWSFYTFSQTDWPLVIHDGGGLAGYHRRAILALFPAAKIVTESEAADMVKYRLGKLACPNLSTARDSHVLMRKLVDFPLFSKTRTIVCLDSDVLFFRMPKDILARAHVNQSRFCFIRDSHSCYSITSEQSERWFGCPLPEKLNSGVCTIPVDGIDYQFLEKAFSPKRIPARGNHFPEQTALALLSMRTGGPEVFPETYSVATGTPPLDLEVIGAVSRHYVGPVRYLFFDEGLPVLIKYLGNNK
jgi:hypothetical protein